MIQNSSDVTNFPHKSLLTDTQVSKLCITFSSANIKFSKTQLPKMIQLDLECFSDIFGEPQNVTANDVGEVIEKKIKDLTKILTNNEIKDIAKVVNSLGNRGILLKETTKKLTSQEWKFFHFRRQLVTAGISLIKWLD